MMPPLGQGDRRFEQCPQEMEDLSSTHDALFEKNDDGERYQKTGQRFQLKQRFAHYFGFIGATRSWLPDYYSVYWIPSEVPPN